MDEAGKGPLDIIQSYPSGSCPCSSGVHQSRLLRLTDFEYPRRRRLHKNSGQPVPVFHDICSNKQINPSYVLIGLPMFQFVPIDSCTFTKNQRKKWLHLYSYSECIINTGKIPVSLLFCRLSPSLSSYYRCTSPLIFLQSFIGLAPACPCFCHAGVH